MVMEKGKKERKKERKKGRKEEPSLWNANANGLNRTKKRELLHPTKNLCDVTLL